MKKIGIISFSQTNHKFMLSLAKKLSKFNKIVFFVCFDTNQFLKNKKIKFVKVFLSEKNVRKKQINSKNNTNYLALQKYKNGEFFNHLIRIKNFFYFLRYILIRYFYSYIKYFNNKIDILISPGDRENIFELSLIKFAVNDQKKVFIYPAAVAADPINSIFYRDKHIVKDSDFIKKFPTQIFKHKKKNYSFFGFYHTKIFNFLNILPSNPWTFAAGKNRKLLVTSNILIEYYKSLGTPKKNIRLIKNEKLEKREIIFKNLVKRYSFFKKKNKLDNNKSILYINLPNWFEHGVITKKKAFERYNDLLVHLEKKKIDKKYNLIVSLHPQQDFYAYKKFLKKYNIKLLNDKFENLLPYIDGLISLAGSSILIDCKDFKIPYLLFDMYENENMNKLYFTNLNKNQIVKSYNDLDINILKKIIKKKKNIRHILNKQILNIENLILRTKVNE